MPVHFRWEATLVLALLAGCAAPAPVMPSGATATPAPAGPRVEGTAALAAGPFAGATVKVYRLDTDALVGEGATDASGAFAVPVSPEALGLALRVEVAKDGKSLGAIAGRLKPGAGYRVAQAADGISGVKVTLASTLALRAFLAQLKAVSVSLLPPGQVEIPVNLLAKLLAAFDRASAGAEGGLAGRDLAALEAAIAQSGALSDDLRAIAGDASAIAQALSSLAEAGVAAGGTAPDPGLFAPKPTATPAPAATPAPQASASSGKAGSNGSSRAPSTTVTLDGGFGVPTYTPSFAP